MSVRCFYNLPPHLPFLDALAGMLLAKHRGDPLELARTLVLLPSRRSCRSLREAFLRESMGTPLLLPRIMPIGEIDGEADILALAGEEVPRIMPEKERLSMLTRLILGQGQTTPARAYQLAVELARLLDETIRHSLDFEKLKELAPFEELAKHWKTTTEFLTIITRQWPRILAEAGMRDEAEVMRDRMLQLAEKWRLSPPDFPVVAAGSTGSIPATAALLRAIAAMPNGMVILPGLDAAMTDAAWDQLDPTHPQYGLRHFLLSSPSRGEAGRGAFLHNVRNITQICPHPNPPPNGEGMSTLFAPAALTARWREAELPLGQDFAHLSLMQADTQNDEARMIAFKLREALEVPEKTAALITPDRQLARMVSAQCARWGIAIDDSAGQPMRDTPGAVFMRLLLEVAVSGAAPLPLLALLRHPFAAVESDTVAAREYSRALEAACLRGVRLQPGMDALVEELKEKTTSAGLQQFIARLRELLRPLEMLFLRNTPAPLAELLAVHCRVAEAIATTQDQSGGDILWAQESGEALSKTLSEWAVAAAALGDILPHDYPALFDALLAREVARRPFGTHPRLHILSPIEARLMHYDLVILGEMNEGIWPAAMTVDPWMSAPMRESFGLPSHAVQTGQSAHDVWMLLHAPEVILSRARKISGSPQEPSRWWVRLATLVGGKNPQLLAAMDISALMQASIDAQDAPRALPPLERPKPVPPPSARPRRFSPSAIDLWSSEPYAFYAKYILGLKALDELDAEPDNREFGELIHSALEHFSAAHPDALPEQAYQILIAQGQREFQPYMHRPSVATLWWPRFEAIARHWLAREREFRRERYSTESEVSAKWEFEIAGERIIFSARADRVDVMAGSFRLIDYKTGTPPGKANVEKGEAKQLPLTALALIRSGRIAASPGALIYWALKTREQGKDFVEISEATDLLARTQEELFAMIAESLTANTPYAPEIIPKLPEYRDEYDHLIRRSEWSGY
ncbi:MAG: double-strand break repair protein AddB [Alphaproteobacteria bacterium]|nr:double-strand break repair protein AddB [Alphaproteobacteria bacterium]